MKDKDQRKKKIGVNLLNSFMNKEKKMERKKERKVKGAAKKE